jgi:type III restriction enzyme
MTSPWNPQRIEQRIGLCHRYGQQHDVGVVNFLNQKNEADQRVFQLLSEKFKLFEGVFGAEVVNVLQYHQQALVNLIHAQMQEHYEEKAAAYEAHVSKGFTTLRPNNYSAPAGEGERDFRVPVTDKHDIRKMLFSGFRKCLYRVQKFDSDSERRFAVILENDKEVTKWFKPAKGSLQIHYASDAAYEPDFVVETKSAKFLCEAKSSSEMTDKKVQAKAKAAMEWCKNATAHEQKQGGKPWLYLLVPHDIISDNKTLQGLAASYSYTG